VLTVASCMLVAELSSGTAHVQQQTFRVRQLIANSANTISAHTCTELYCCYRAVVTQIIAKNMFLFDYLKCS
jgi:hypothetical protein